jgi:hypothetical protein
MAAAASPSPQTTRLGALVEQSWRAARTSRELVACASAARAAAVEAIERASIHRRQREAWAEILDRIPADPDHLLILCAYCHRARGENGWTVLPTGVEMELHAWPGVLLQSRLLPRLPQAPAARVRSRVVGLIGHEPARLHVPFDPPSPPRDRRRPPDIDPLWGASRRDF